MTRPRFLLCTAALTFLLAVAISTTSVQTAPAAPQAPAAQTPAAQTPAKPPAQPATPQAQAAGEYVGQDTCIACHDDRAYSGTRHGHAFNERTPAATQGCESCHGPGKAHAETGEPEMMRSFAEMTASEASDTCTTCHNRSTHALWDGSQHDQRNVSCLSCHSVHAPQGEPQLKARDERALCASCHRPITNRQHRFSHMPLREGAMRCSSCHNPHGSQNVKLLRVGTTIDESCQSCHADKRGPYLWEHAPVAESCVTCHEPHGTNNERMLVSKQPFLCQRCHVTSRHPPTVYEGFLLNNSQNANKLFARGCTNCHTMVHGSNAPSGKSLLR